MQKLDLRYVVHDIEDCVVLTNVQEQSCEHFNSAMYTLNKCKVNSERSTFQDRNKLTKITHCKRVKSQTRNVKMSKTLNFNHSKIGKNLTTSKKTDKNYIDKTGYK